MGDSKTPKHYEKLVHPPAKCQNPVLIFASAAIISLSIFSHGFMTAIFGNLQYQYKVIYDWNNEATASNHICLPSPFLTAKRKVYLIYGLLLRAGCNYYSILCQNNCIYETNQLVRIMLIILT